jgi:hypothetical protein
VVPLVSVAGPHIVKFLKIPLVSVAGPHIVKFLKIPHVCVAGPHIVKVLKNFFPKDLQFFNHSEAMAAILNA